MKIFLYFDGAPPPGAPEVEHLGSVTVTYVPYVDPAIVGRVGSSGRGWKVATDDRALALRVRAAGARVVPGAAFWGRVRAAASRGEGRGSQVDVDEELRFFEDESNRLAGERRLPKRRRKKR